MSVLSLEDVHTYYGESHILEGVSLEIEAGESVALVGRNGVGKTTTIRSILQLTPPRSGTVSIRGESVVGERPYQVADRGVGWIPEGRRVFSQLSVEENVRVAVPDPNDVGQALEQVYETFPDLRDKRHRNAGSLSGGQQQMLAIARGLVGGNDILLVDEPSEGLAPIIVETVADALSNLPSSTTLLLVEQNLPLALDLTDRFYVLDNGQVVDDGESAMVSADDEQLRRHLGT